MKAVAILGDSLACPRPWEGIPIAGTYAYLLQQHAAGGLYVMNWSAGDTTSERLTSEGFLRTYVAGVDLHAAVIHVGICDCAPRLMNGVERVIGAFAARAPIVGGAFRSYINMKKRYRFQLTRLFPRTLVSVDDFEQNLLRLVAALRSRSPETKIIFINIAAPGESLVAKSYQVRENILRYNEAIARICAQPNCALIDLYERTQAHPEWIAASDGHHIRPEAHRWLARELAALFGYGD